MVATFSKRGDPFGRALLTLRYQLRIGSFGQGRPLAIIEIARDLGLSPTPVREALSRLAGEGLVEELRGRGFFSRHLDSGELVDLYDLELLQLGFAVDAFSTNPNRWTASDALRGTQSGDEWRNEDDLASQCEMVLGRLAAASGSRALRASYQSVADQLGPARRAEPNVLAGVGAEVSCLRRLFGEGDWKGLRSELYRFHKRRRAAANETAAMLRGLIV
jgi:hypothetical protein